MSTPILIKLEACCLCCSQGLNPRLIMWVVDFTPSSSSQKGADLFQDHRSHKHFLWVKASAGCFHHRRVLGEQVLNSLKKKKKNRAGGAGRREAYEPLGNGCFALLAPCAPETVVHFTQSKTLLYSKYIKNPLPLHKRSPAKEWTFQVS